MKIITKAVKLNREEYFKKHLLIINHLLPVQMTNKEAEFLANFISLEGELAKDPFSTLGRNIVKRRMKIQSGGVSNYLDQLKTKKFIKEDKDGNFTILPLLIPNKEGQLYQFKLEINE